MPVGLVSAPVGSFAIGITITQYIIFCLFVPGLNVVFGGTLLYDTAMKHRGKCGLRNGGSADLNTEYLFINK